MKLKAITAYDHKLLSLGSSSSCLVTADSRLLLGVLSDMEPFYWWYYFKVYCNLYSLSAHKEDNSPLTNYLYLYIFTVICWSDVCLLRIILCVHGDARSRAARRCHGTSAVWWEGCLRTLRRDNRQQQQWRRQTARDVPAIAPLSATGKTACQILTVFFTHMYKLTREVKWNKQTFIFCLFWLHNAFFFRFVNFLLSTRYR